MKPETFSDMFNVVNVSSGNIKKGSSCENLIVILGVKASDFEALLKVLHAA